jgi:hypothetical protein
MHDDYFAVGRARAPQTAGSGWWHYRGAVPAKVTMGLLALHLLFQLVLIGGRLVAPITFAGPAVQGAAGIALLALTVATGIAFVIWFHRAYVAVDLAVGAAHDTSQAAWAFFVPIMNLFRPYQLATEIWRKSHDRASGGHSALIIAWWGLWVVFGTGPLFISVVGLRSGSRTLGSPLSFGSMLATVALTGCAIAVVRTLDGRIRNHQGAGERPATF